MKHDFEKYPTLELHPIERMNLLLTINELFDRMKERTRENYYKLCLNFYEDIRKRETKG